MNVAILGCGPSGLLAAHAAEQRGHEVVIISRKIKSEINGAMFLHLGIPGINEVAPDFMIQVIKNGVREGYAENVYNDPSHPVSWDKFEGGPFPAWDLRAVYDKLWEAWELKIIDREYSHSMLTSLLDGSYAVISTIPRTVTCLRPAHRFTSQDIWIERLEGGLIERVNDDNLMYYNGFTPDGKYGMIGPPWYRYCQINGLRSWEYAKPRDPVSEIGGRVIRGFKPIATTCDCWPQVMFAGRFGQWQKQILTHHVYEAVYDALQ
jgi:hypothetical protein